MATSQLTREEEWNTMELKSLKVTFIWTINNYTCQIKHIGYQLKSPTFSSDCSGNILWYLTVAPSGLNESSKDYLSLYLHPVLNYDINVVSATVKLSIVSNTNEKTMTLTHGIPYRFYRDSHGFGSAKFAPTDYLLDPENEFLPDDVLTIICEMHIIDTIIKSSTTHPTRSPVASRVTKTRLIDDMARLFENQMLSDITLTANGKKFKAHKNVLGARSPVFAAMFSHNMRENNLNIVEITDMDDHVLHEILRFIYTGEVHGLDLMATDLFVAADKYAIPDLADLCEETLCSQLSIQNAADVLVLADMHKLKKLKTETMKYINKYISPILETEGWSCLVRDHSHLLNEVLIYHVSAEIFNF